MKTAIIAILAVAVLLLAAIAFLRKKQVNSLQEELERQKRALFDSQLEYRNLRSRVTRLCADKPKTLTAQYMAMKLSRLMPGYIIADGDNCYIDVLAPATESAEEDE